jgi:hypothetical protein
VSDRFAARALAVILSTAGYFAVLVGWGFLRLEDDPDWGPVDPAYPVGAFSIGAALLAVALVIAVRSARSSALGAALWTLALGAVLPGALVVYALLPS